MAPGFTEHCEVGVGHPSAGLPVTQATPFTNSLRKNEGDAVEAMVTGSRLLSTPFQVTFTGTAGPGAVSHGI